MHRKIDLFDIFRKSCLFGNHRNQKLPFSLETFDVYRKTFFQFIYNSQWTFTKKLNSGGKTHYWLLFEVAKR